MALNDYLFRELRFVGNDVQYEDPRNSFLNDVLDRRTGIPITLALLYMEVAQTRRPARRRDQLSRAFPAAVSGRARGLPYSRGSDHRRLSRRRAALRESPAAAGAGTRRRGSGPDEDPLALESRLLLHATKPQILTRMLLNLKRVYVRMHSFPQARDVTELLARRRSVGDSTSCAIAGCSPIT